ncbi:beta-hexosaminidase subunit beta-like [Nasonia vitripennis]|uniref:Beta-hexosaminidase n=1 Tax=Nasonia vitripennis TaxID=7425 RepID=A0A7M7Q678_NASVI|nr:beta-hexosaminidase subunit beta-like [Nasonia vitripennis]
MPGGGILVLGLLALLSTTQVTEAWHDGSGPWVIATQGEPWPLPNQREVNNVNYRLEPSSFNFQIAGQTCDILVDTVKRYKDILVKEFEVAQKLASHKPDNENTIYEGLLLGLEIHLKQPCEMYPRLSSNETYTLSVPGKTNKKIAILSADSIWGILRGLETFSQLVTHSENEPGLIMKGQTIVDSPRLPHRGLLIDTSRHYLPIADIKLILDAMSYNKLNVLHWHIVDDNSFPYESTVYPELSAKGAYHPSMIYTVDDITAVIEYARFRGIRVLPEFDTPGHTQSWGLSHPEFLTPCYDETGKPTGKLGPMNPTKQPLYGFLKTLFGEVTARFPDNYIHLGGDEVPYDCWKSNPEINRFMQKNNISTKYAKLEELYIQRVLDIVDELKVKPIVWQEVFNNGVKMHEGTAVQVWTGAYKAEMADVTAAGHPALLSACWYLSEITSGGDWLKFYRCDPLSFKTTSSEQLKLVLGGEACMWGEYVNKNNVHPRIWPRASATAERLWSNTRQDDETAAQRLEEHACRMNRRNIPAQPPNGSGFCIS